MSNIKNTAQLEQEHQRNALDVVAHQAIGEIATAVLLRYGNDIQDVSDTRGPISGDMTAGDVYKQVGIAKSSLTEEQIAELDKSASTIADLSQPKVDPEEKEIAGILIEDEVKKMEDSLLATKATHDALKAGRKPKEAKATQDIQTTPDEGEISKLDESISRPARIRGSRLPSMDDVKVIRVLRRAGFKFDRQDGTSHAIYKSDDGRQATVPKGHGDIPTGTRDSIFNQAGIDDPRIYF
jgi:predicted RNA binding protein YcfA (HicA-like mRNA interferase family)